MMITEWKENKNNKNNNINKIKIMIILLKPRGKVDNIGDKFYDVLWKRNYGSGKKKSFFAIRWLHCIT